MKQDMRQGMKREGMKAGMQKGEPAKMGKHPMQKEHDAMHGNGESKTPAKKTRK